MSSAIDLQEAVRFLDLMAEGEQVSFQTFDDRAERKNSQLAAILHGDLSTHARALQQLNERGAGIFWMVNAGDGKGRRAENVARVRAVFVDLDGAPLQPVLEAGAEPHAIIESSPGRWHAYWLVSDCELAQFEPMQKALAARFSADSKVHDLPRVLRLPGFLHLKGQPFRSRIVSLERFGPYTLSDLLQRLALDLTQGHGAEVDPATGEIRDRIAPGLPIPMGHRNEQLFRMGCQLRGSGYGERAILAALSAENEERCKPPMPAAELRAVARQAAKFPAGCAHAEHMNTPLQARAFIEVPLQGLASWQPEHPGWWWDGYMPAREVTGLSAHGGTGKSTLAAILGAHIALGLPYLGRPTRQGRVLYFSAEDPASVLRFRVAKVARQFELDCEALSESLHILDATEGFPVLWADARTAGTGHAGLTASYRELQGYIEAHQIDVVLIDNASDVFAGDEINRAAVRAFMQSLAALVRPRGGAVLLLLHVDKASARGVSTGSDNYSGSTAWHNSARSRLFLKRQGEGLELLHEKCNHGPLLPPLMLEWPEGGLPLMVRAPAPIVAAIQARNDAKAVLRLIDEFAQRGEFVTTAQTGPGNYRTTLCSDKKCPQLKPAELADLLRTAERQGHLIRETYRNAARKTKERFTLTNEGRAFIEVAPVAPVAPVPENQHNPRNPNDGAAPVAPVRRRGYGGKGGAQNRSANP